MRSPVTALICLTLLVACARDAATPTSPSQTETPLFSAGAGSCPTGTGVGKVPLECGDTHEVYYYSGNPIGTNLTALAAAEEAVLRWQSVFSDSIYNLPGITWASGKDPGTMEGEKAIQISLDNTGDGDYWCGWTPGSVITIKETDANSSGCDRGQATSDLVGLIMHEFTHVVSPSFWVTAADPTYEECLFTHYTYESPAHGHPREVCEWDEQYVFYKYGLRTTQPDFYNPIITGATLTASADSVTVGQSVVFTVTAQEELGAWTTGSAGSFPKTWSISGPGEFSPTPGEYSDSATVTTSDTLGLGTDTVDVGLKPYATVVWPEPSARDSVIVRTAVTSVAFDPPSLTLTDDDETTLYQDITAVTSPVPGVDYDWSSSNQSVARVVGGGSTVTVEGYSSGIALISVLVDGVVSDTATVTVRCGTKSNPSCIQYGPVPMGPELSH